MAIQQMQTDGGQTQAKTTAPYQDPNWSPTATTQTPATTSLPTLNIGTRGEQVSTLQRQLQAAGFNPGVIDGIYGNQTAAAVKQYQQANNLTVDGIAGQQTLSSLAQRYTGNIAPWSVTNTQTQQAVSQQTSPVPTQTPTSTPQPSTGIKTPSLPSTGTGGSTSTGGMIGVSPTVGAGGAQTGISLPEMKPTIDSSISAPQFNIEIPKVDENPYLQELHNMQFQYNPFEDPDYLQTASGIENQVAQAMVGRGGLYSSVAQSAVNSKLISLQNDFRAQKYNEYLQNRTFTMQMAQFTHQMQQQQFENQFQMMRHQFDIQREAFGQQMDIAKFNLAQQSEMFDQQFKIAQFEFQQREAAYDRQYRAEQMAFQREQAAYDRQYKEAQLRLQAENVRLANEQALFQQQEERMLSNFYIGTSELVANKKQMDSLLNKWESQGVATGDVALFFGVTMGTAYNSKDAGTARYQRQREVEMASQMYITAAEEYNYGKISQDFIRDITRVREFDGEYNPVLVSSIKPSSQQQTGLVQYGK